MIDPILPLSKERRQFLYELGLLGANNLLGMESLVLFSALERSEPDQAYPKVGLGFVLLMAQQHDLAEEKLSDPIVKQSNLAGYAEVIRAFGRKLRGDTNGFEQIAKEADTCDLSEASRGLLEVLRNQTFEVPESAAA